MEYGLSTRRLVDYRANGGASGALTVKKEGVFREKWDFSPIVPCRLQCLAMSPKASFDLSAVTLHPSRGLRERGRRLEPIKRAFKSCTFENRMSPF